VAIFIITAVALIGAVLLAHRRRRMAVGLLIASTLSFLLALAEMKALDNATAAFLRDHPQL
jgi:hypothetical protein